MLKIDCELTLNAISSALKDFFKKNGFQKTVVGLSGGIDSALVLKILTLVLGSENCFALILPYKTSTPESIADAVELSAKWKVEYRIIDITPQIDAYFSQIENFTPLQLGNKCARERMTILYDFSSRVKALVAGTSNKSELLIGYSTQFGDSAAAILPVGDLYKTQIWQLSEFLKIPEKIIQKKPTADLWPGQTDESEIGIEYKELDEILFQLIDLRLSVEEVIARGYDRQKVKRICEMISSTQFKRTMPVIVKISARTVGHDFRYSRDWKH